MANALKKITTAAKAIRKKSPGTSWKSAVKKAGAMYRGGKLKAKKKRKVSGSSVGAVKKTRRKKRNVSALPRVLVKIAPRKRRRKSVKRRAVTRRRVSGSGGKDKLIQTLAIGGLALGLFIAFTRQRSTYPTYQNTGNNYRDSRAQQILSIAQQAALSATQIFNLINTINQSSDAQLDAIYNNVNAGADISAYA